MSSTSPKPPLYRRKRWLIGAGTMLLVVAASAVVLSRATSAPKATATDDKALGKMGKAARKTAEQWSPDNGAQALIESLKA